MSSYPTYGSNLAHIFPASSFTRAYLAHPYGTLSNYQQQPQQPLPTFPVLDRSQQPPSNVYGQQTMYPPASYQAQPRSSQSSQKPQPFYPSYHPPPFASSDKRSPASAAFSKHPGSHVGYSPLSPLLPAASLIVASSQQQQPLLCGHQPGPDFAPQARPSSSPGPGAQKPGLLRLSSPSLAASHPLHLTSLMNAPATATKVSV